jgi:SAM-dependent methyltransferase
MNTSEVTPQRYLTTANEANLGRHGDSHLSVGYASPAEATERYAIMLGATREKEEAVSLLDLGCGLAHMLDYIRSDPQWDRIRYTGADLSSRFIEAARERHPDADLIELDILDRNAALPDYDYVVISGLFNYRGELSRGRMLAYWKRMTSTAFRHCRRGIVFNVMSKLVDWERDDLFHLPFNTMSRFVAEELSRHFVIRHDYDAYEYTVYVYRSPSTF